MRSSSFTLVTFIYQIMSSHFSFLVAAAIIVSCSMLVSTSDDEVLFRPFCSRPTIKTLVGFCYDTLPVSLDNVLGKDVYSAANSGKVEITAQDKTIASAFTVVSSGYVEFTCTCYVTKTLSSSERIAIVPNALGESVTNMKALVEVSSTRSTTSNHYKGGTIVYQTTVPFSCSWKPKLPNLPTEVKINKIFKCTDKPSSDSTWPCQWVDPSTEPDFVRYSSLADRKPELSKQGEGVLATSTASCTAGSDSETFTCGFNKVDHSRLRALVIPKGATQVGLVKALPSARLTLHCKLVIYWYNWHIYMKLVCWWTNP